MIGASGDAKAVLIDAFLRYIFLFMAVLSTAFVVTSVQRLCAEEEAGRAEVVLATGVRRSLLLVSSTLVAALGALLVTLLMGLGLAVGYALGMGEWDQLARQVGGQLSYLPGVLLIAGAAVAIVGMWPRASLLAWGAVVFALFHVMLGERLRLPGWIDAFSPFWHLPSVPMEAFTPTPAVIEADAGCGPYRPWSLGLRTPRRRDGIVLPGGVKSDPGRNRDERFRAPERGPHPARDPRHRPRYTPRTCDLSAQRRRRHPLPEDHRAPQPHRLRSSLAAPDPRADHGRTQVPPQNMGATAKASSGPYP